MSEERDTLRRARLPGRSFRQRPAHQVNGPGDGGGGAYPDDDDVQSAMAKRRRRQAQPEAPVWNSVHPQLLMRRRQTARHEYIHSEVVKEEDARQKRGHQSRGEAGSEVTGIAAMA